MVLIIIFLFLICVVDDVISNHDNDALLLAVKKKCAKICAAFPLNDYVLQRQQQLYQEIHYMNVAL